MIGQSLAPNSTRRTACQALPLADDPLDRRIQPRVEPGRVRSLLRESQLFEQVETLDLSTTGARLETGRALQTGARVTLNLNMAGRMVGLPGVVVWSRGTRTGVAFQELRGADAVALSRWIYRQGLVG